MKKKIVCNLVFYKGKARICFINLNEKKLTSAANLQKSQVELVMFFTTTNSKAFLREKNEFLTKKTKKD